jgi:RNA polymerase sigma factor (sigma-70 family)
LPAAVGHERTVELDDSTLWARTRVGDRDAFGTLFERHANAIYNYCFRRIGDWAIAEDLVSVVFLEAWRRRDQELPPDKVLAWLYGIAANVVRNRRRHERRYAAALRRMPPPRPESDFADETEIRLDDERRMRRALAFLARLPRRERDVLVLCEWLDVSYDDTAFALGIPVGTVRSRLSRARRRLRELDGDRGHEAGTEAQPVKEAFEP